MPFLIDTIVLSELRKGPRADSGVTDWFQRATTADLFLSVLTVGELRAGAERIRRRDRMAATAIDRWLAALLTYFSSRILPIDQPTAETWGELAAGRTLPVVDGLLAATAMVGGFTLVTRNIRDFAGLPVELHDPFSRRNTAAPRARHHRDGV